ncbi:hypothetical protein VNI00_014843 [Paramarasmius palmivorus]|uniref:BTB domain-containing protein n=1 Tax=Paramarasmius palmivorus TaxID=297713 RepID=A0AAW0BRZ9_9AGAR
MSDDSAQYSSAQELDGSTSRYTHDVYIGNQSYGAGSSSPSSPDASTTESLIRKRKRSDTSESCLSEIQAAGGLVDPRSPTMSVIEMDFEGASGSGTTPGYTRHRLSVSLKHDSTYYFEDGSCVLLVQDTLFNVHRTMLSKDNSSFSTMFTLPQGTTEAEGRSDDNPIILTGDKPSEFRHFLWALYAIPPDLCQVTSSGADLTLLIDIARISNKYSFKSMETWALDAIQSYVERKPSPLFLSLAGQGALALSGAETSLATNPTPVPGIESSAQLTKLIQLAQLCGHERLLSTMVGLLRQLMSKSLQYAYLAMTLADELDLRALRGAAYLEVMQRATVVRRGSTAIAIPHQGDLDEEGRLVITPAQQLRLLTGYWHLTRTWERIRVSPPQFVHATACGATWHQHGCTQSWVEFWKDKTKGDAVLLLGLADVMGRLRQVQKDYDRWGSATYMHHDCRVAARRSIADLIKRVEEKLPDYFSDDAYDSDEA